MTDSFDTTVSNPLRPLAERLAGQADGAIQSARHSGNGMLHGLQDGVHRLEDTVPPALARAADQVEDLAQRSLEQARHAGVQMRQAVSHSVRHAGDSTSGFIQHEPLKALLMAAAAGAALATVVGWLSRRHDASPRH